MGPLHFWERTPKLSELLVLLLFSWMKKLTKGSQGLGWVHQVCFWLTQRRVLDGPLCNKLQSTAYACWHTFAMYRRSSGISSVLLGTPWPAVRGSLRNHFWTKRGIPPSVLRGREFWNSNALEASNAWNYRGWELPNRTLDGEFQEKLWKRFQGLSRTFPEFLPESPSRTAVLVLLVYGVTRQHTHTHF